MDQTCLLDAIVSLQNRLNLNNTYGWDEDDLAIVSLQNRLNLNYQPFRLHLYIAIVSLQNRLNLNAADQGPDRSPAIVSLQNRLNLNFSREKALHINYEGPFGVSKIRTDCWNPASLLWVKRHLPKLSFH